MIFVHGSIGNLLPCPHASLPRPPAIPEDPGYKVLHTLAFLVLAGLSTFAFLR